MRYFVSFLLLSIVFSCSFAGCNKLSTDISSTEVPQSSTTDDPVVTIPTASPSPQKIDVNNISIDILPTSLASLADWYNNAPILLLSLLETDNIYLYGISESSTDEDCVILRVEDSLYTFNWNYITPRLILPTLYYSDFDSDGMKEIAVILYNGSGTGISIEELHVLEKTQEGWQDNVLSGEQYMNKLREELSYSFDESTKNVTLTSKSNKITFPSYNEYTPNGIFFGDIVDYSCEDNKFSCCFAIGMAYEEEMFCTYKYHAISDITYKDGNFILAPFTLS